MYLFNKGQSKKMGGHVPTLPAQLRRPCYYIAAKINQSIYQKLGIIPEITKTTIRHLGVIW